MPGDRLFRVCFPPPIVLHGSDHKSVLEAALEYLRLPGKIVIEPHPEKDREETK